VAISRANAVTFGPFRLDADTGSVWRDAEEIRLRPKSFAILRYLADRPHRLVTKEELLEGIWPGVAVGDAALAVCVGEIRRVLGDKARMPRFIETLHRRGYRFIGSALAAPGAEPTAERLRTNLPRQLTSFVGRQRERDRVRTALSDSALVTLTGAGGVGKTRLAIEVGAELLPDFTHGVWLVDLASLSDIDRVPDAVAAALLVREQAGRPMLEVVLDYLRPKRVLLVLDNCEHLIAAAATLADALLRECASLRILATSREALGVGGEAIQAIPPLAVPPPDTTKSVDGLTRFEAVSLFVERAGTLLPGFSPTERNGRAINEVCRRLDGIPLAIELAAARITSMAVEEIAARLDDRFRLLTGGSRTALPRHQTLRGVLDWSHQLLSDGERVLLRRLSTFTGGFSLEAAERVCAGGELAARDVIDLLARLVEQSLVVFDQSGAEPRYRLLETIRQYAQARLVDSGEADAIRSNHLEHYLAFAEHADTLLRGPAQMAWLTRLGTEHDNLRAALGWSLTQTDHAEDTVRLAAALQWFWFMRGLADEGRRWLDRALSRDREAAAAVRTRALAGLGMLAHRANDFAQARTALVESLALARALGEESTTAFALHHLAHVTQILGGPQQAMEMFEESESLFSKIGDRWGTAWSLRCLGNHERARGVTPDVVSRLEASLALSREVADEYMIANALLSLGAMTRQQQDYARANALLEESLAIWRAAGADVDTAGAYRELGHVARSQGDHHRAATLYRASIELFRETSNSRQIGYVLEGVAALSTAQGQFQQAARILGAADGIRLGIGALWVERQIHEPTVAKTREALGDQAFEAAFAQGREMSLDETMSLVRHLADGLETPDHPAAKPQSGVTARPRRRSPTRGTGNRRDRAEPSAC
jgi:predicted ATPase/DNA-binding winged helix-turn-helix (wHTH) protein